MKKISKILGIITCAFVLMLSCTLLTACKSNDSVEAKPYSVKGVTLAGTKEGFVVWADTISQEDKDAFWASVDAKDEKEYFQNLAFDTITYKFNEDGTLVMSNPEYGEKTFTYYYEQSADLKTISLYEDVEDVGKDEYVYFNIVYINGEYYLLNDTISKDIMMYAKLKKA